MEVYCSVWIKVISHIQTHTLFWSNNNNHTYSYLNCIVEHDKAKKWVDSFPSQKYSDAMSIFYIYFRVHACVCVCQNNHLQWKRVSAHRCWRCNAIKLMMCLICTQNLSMCSEISRPIQMPTSIHKTLEDVCLLSVYWRFTHVIDVSYTTCTQWIRHGYDVAWAAPTLIYVCAGVWSDKVDIGQYHLTSSY